MALQVEYTTRTAFTGDYWRISEAKVLYPVRVEIRISLYKDQAARWADASPIYDLSCGFPYTVCAYDRGPEDHEAHRHLMYEAIKATAQQQAADPDPPVGPDLRIFAEAIDV